MNKETENTVVNFVLWTIVLVLSLLNTAWMAYILQAMWGWWAVPEGFKSLGFATAVGITIIVNFLTLNPFVKQQEPEFKHEKAVYNAFFNVLKAAFIRTTFFVVAAFWHFVIL